MPEAMNFFNIGNTNWSEKCRANGILLIPNENTKYAPNQFRQQFGSFNPAILLLGIFPSKIKI